MVKSGSTLKTLEAPEKTFSELRTSKFSIVVPLNIFVMVPGTIKGGTGT